MQREYVIEPFPLDDGRMLYQAKVGTSTYRAGSPAELIKFIEGNREWERARTGYWYGPGESFNGD